MDVEPFELSCYKSRPFIAIGFKIISCQQSKLTVTGKGHRIGQNKKSNHSNDPHASHVQDFCAVNSFTLSASVGLLHATVQENDGTNSSFFETA